LNTKHWLRLGAAVLACALSACGGGGGGGGDDLRVTSDRNSLTLVGVNGVMPASLPITFTLSGGDGTYYGMAVSDNDAFVASFNPQSDTTATVRIAPAGNVPLGTQSSGRITFKLCHDANCIDTAWSQQIPYVMTMFSLDATPVELVGHEGAVSEPVTRAINPPDTAGLLVFTLHDSTGITVDHSQPGHVAYTGSGVGLAAGSYTATHEIGYRVDGLEQSLMYGSTVSLTVGNGAVAPAVAAIDVTSATTATSLVGSAPVRFVGTQSPAWTATSDSPWLVLDTASGNGAGEIAYHVDATLLAELPNWSVNTAQVTLNAAGLSSVSFPLTLNKSLPEVAMVSPSGVVSGQPVTVRVSGRGLSQLSGASSFRVGDVQPTSVSIESDTSATLQLPALTAGATKLRAINALGDEGIAVAVVGASPSGTFTSTSVVHRGEKGAAVFDASRNAVYATDRSNNRLVRYRLAGGQWTVATLSLNNIAQLALAPDRATVYVTAGDQVVAVDPDTLKVLSRHDGEPGLGLRATSGEALAVTSNLRMWLPSGEWADLSYFDMRRGSFGTLDSDLDMYLPLTFASGDGRKMFVNNPGYLSPPVPNYWYNTASDALGSNANMPPANGTVELDERGSVGLVDNHSLHRTSDWALLGKPEVSPQSPEGWGWSAVISPDGRRIYRQVVESDTAIDHLEVFDTARQVPGTSNFVSLGTIPLPIKAVGCTDFDGICDRSGRFLIDPTGTTLFWVGGERMVVIPIPEALSGLNAGAQSNAPGRLLRAATAR
jgi:hypothetical protein